MTRGLFGGMFRIAAVFGLVALVASGAQAAVVVGTLGSGPLGAGDSGIFIDFTNTIGSGNVWQFTVSEPVSFGASAIQFNFPPSFGFSSFDVALVEATGSGGTDFSAFNLLASGTPGGGGLLTLSYASLLSGSLYGLLFTGSHIGFGGLYAGVFSVSAVPLPPAVWLFLSALIGLVGVVRHKRQRAVPAKVRQDEVPQAA